MLVSKLSYKDLNIQKGDVAVACCHEAVTSKADTGSVGQTF
jgi:peptidyl-tRNA hydrolase